MAVDDPLRRLVQAMTIGFDNLRHRVTNLEIQETYSNHIHSFSEMAPGGECQCGTNKWPGGQIHFCIDCLKVGETPGNGTGTPVYCNKADGTWRRVRDDAIATA